LITFHTYIYIGKLMSHLAKYCVW